MTWKGIVGQKFTPDQFLQYVRGLSWDDWVPEFIVLHHTEDPSLAMRPHGIDEEQIQEWVSWYRYHNKWSGGPHVFVDDHAIWVFTPLTVPGVHANSWNSQSIGVEMLGDFRRESFDAGRGLTVQQNTVVAVAILSMSLGLDPETMRLHKENGETEHDCPGEHVDKLHFIQAVKECIAGGYS